MDLIFRPKFEGWFLKLGGVFFFSVDHQALTAMSCHIEVEVFVMNTHFEHYGPLLNPTVLVG
jgi:hypothetical protein